LSDNDINSGKEEVLQIMDKIADKVCSGCAMINFCWESSFYETYQSVMGLITSLEGRGRILPDEIPKYLIKNCCRINNLLPEAKSAFDMWKIESLWRKRLQESRQMLPSQLDGMSGILESLADEVNLSVSFVESMEKNILKVMNNKEIRVKNTTVCRNRYGRYEVSLEAKCCSGKRNCVTCYSEAVSEALGVKMSCDDNTCVNPAGNPWCSLTFSEEESFKTATGIASAKAFGSAVTGDSHSFFDVNRGIHMAALSDGMGTGEKASKQSKNVIKLLELFMESGLEKYSAVSMINSLLFTGTEKELSATIDLALFDLYEGRVSFLKFGAVPAVIKRNNRVETVVISSLPVGLVRTSSNYKTIDRKLENGDFVILMTDGIDEAYRRAGKSDLDLFAYIENFDSRNPQDMADKIIAKAMALSGNQPTDDMMVLVTKVWKSA
ncbi:MAG: SpoIIE family protein phosphatase, partial [Clostridiales bacterium]|nr:SpoIIE family protein phosphatase [Clostridiales bacterium]